MENSSEGFVLGQEVVEHLKCSYCKLYLSYGPIFMTTQEDVKFKCARCNVKTRFCFRNLIYENLAKHMKFPCVYKNCKEILPWDNVRDHEANCDHRTIPCLASDCQETVLEREFAAHFKEKHKKLYHNGSISIETLRSNYGFCVLEKDDKCFVLLYDSDIDKIRLCVTYLGAKKLEKQFEVTFHGKNHKSIVLTEQNLVQFQERVHCYKCLKGDCKCIFHSFRDYRRGLLNYTHSKMDKDLLKRTFGNEIGCIINIVDEKTENYDEIDDLLLGGKDVVIDEVNEEDDGEKPAEPVKTDVIKDMLKCQACREPLKETIFQCLSGHAICRECKGKTEKCTKCESKIDNTRNYIIEEAVSNLKLFEHPVEDKLEDKEIVCPMSKCKKTVLLSTISNHFKESHIANFHFNKVTLSNVYGYYNVDVLVKDGKTYLLLFDFDDFHFGISVCSIDPTDKLYEVKLMPDNKRYSLIATDQKVIKFNDKEHCFKCSIGICEISDHTYRVKRMEIFRRLTTKFNRDCIKRAFKSSSLTYQIILKEPKQDKNDKVLKQLFECPICKDYMIPPIHQCVAGHTLCKVCKTKVEKCPSCEGSIEVTRNLLLEDISDVVDVPCSFETESCSFRAGIKRIASHELECPLNKKKVCVVERPANNQDNSETPAISQEESNEVSTSLLNVGDGSLT